MMTKCWISTARWLITSSSEHDESYLSVARPVARISRMGFLEPIGHGVKWVWEGVGKLRELTIFEG